MKIIITLVILLQVFLNADEPYLYTQRVQNILFEANSYLLKERIIEEPPKPYVLSIRDIKSEGDFVNLETVATYNDGSYVENKYVGDSVFVLCLEKVSGQWKVIYDLSRSDVPSEDEMKDIKRKFPPKFPKKLLSPFWQDLFIKLSS